MNKAAKTVCISPPENPFIINPYKSRYMFQVAFATRLLPGDRRQNAMTRETFSWQQ
jgi:hypothetical protein